MGNEQRTGVYDLRENPSLSDLFAAADRNLRVTIRTATVGKLAPSQQQPLGYDPATQLCSVLVQQLTVTTNPATAQGPGSTITQPPLLLVNVPVAWPRTSAGYLTFPLVIGDSGELIIQDRSLAEWRGKGYPVDPVDNWTHNRGDAVFHPGLHTDTDTLPATSMTSTVLEGPALAGVQLGRSATLGAARLTDTVAPETSMADWLVDVSALLATMAGVINGLAPGSIPPSSIPIPPTDFGVIASASTKVLTE